jgi:cytoskeletal protein RodZ
MGKNGTFQNGDETAGTPDGGGCRSGASAGDLLREARLELRQDLEDVAIGLRIRYVYLQAIEEGRFADLPGNAYAVGFLRSYAEYLGIDPYTVVRRYKDEISGADGKLELVFPTPVPEGSSAPGGAVLLAALVLALTVYGGWYYLSATDRSMADMVPTLPDRLVSLLDHRTWTAPAAEAPSRDVKPPPAAPRPAPAPVVAAQVAAPSRPVPPPMPAPRAAAVPAPPPASPSATPVQAVPVLTAVAPTPAAAGRPGTAMASLPVVAPPAASASAIPNDDLETVAQEPTPLSPDVPALSGSATPAPAPPTPAPPAPAATLPATAGVAAIDPSRIFGTPSLPSRIQLRATQDTWVQVRDAGNGEVLFTRLMKSGDYYRVPDRQGMRLRTGNAGGLVVIADGVEGQPVGGTGQVLRDLSLDAPPARPAAQAPTTSSR